MIIFVIFPKNGNLGLKLKVFKFLGIPGTESTRAPSIGKLFLAVAPSFEAEESDNESDEQLVKKPVEADL